MLLLVCLLSSTFTRLTKPSVTFSTNTRVKNITVDADFDAQETYKSDAFKNEKRQQRHPSFSQLIEISSNSFSTMHFTNAFAVILASAFFATANAATAQTDLTGR